MRSWGGFFFRDPGLSASLEREGGSRVKEGEDGTEQSSQKAV